MFKAEYGKYIISIHKMIDSDNYLIVRDNKYLYFLDLATKGITKVGIQSSGSGKYALQDNLIQIRDEEDNLKIMFIEYDEYKKTR